MQGLRLAAILSSIISLATMPAHGKPSSVFRPQYAHRVFEALEVRSLMSADAGYAAVTAVNVQVDAIDSDLPSIVGRHVFYNNSSFDGNDPESNVGDDAAIALDKAPLFPGSTASFANYTSFVRGINGVMIDVANAAGEPQLTDFVFRAGNSKEATDFLLLDNPQLSYRQLTDQPTITRISLVWPDFTVKNTWLEITTKPGGSLGLPIGDVFYFGNAVGESGNTADEARVTLLDELLARNNTTYGTTADVNNRFDYNRDARVSVIDQLIARNQVIAQVPALALLAPKDTPLIDRSTVRISPNIYSAAIQWTTLQECNVSIEVGETPKYELPDVSNAESTLTHTLTVVGLQPGKRYYYRITCMSALGSSESIAGSFETVMPAYTTPVPIGTNLGEITYYSSSLAFSNLFDMAKSWVTHNSDNSGPWDTELRDQMPVDDSGWPREVPFVVGDSKPQVVKTLLARVDGNYPSGKYLLTFEGSGTVSLGLDVNKTVSAVNGGTFEFQVTTPSAAGIELTIVNSSSENPIRNIRVYTAEVAAAAATSPFNPTFVDKLGSFGFIRFMDWANTNSSLIEKWADRSQLGYYTQAQPAGVAIEYMIDLANQLNVSPWFCVPTHASDDYVRQMAELIHKRLKPDLRAYIEYSNEVWNSAFPQAKYAKARGLELGLSANEYEAQLKYYAMRSFEVFSIFNEEFDTEPDRLIRVVSTQAASSRTATIVLSAMSDPIINPKRVKVDALAIAPYFGNGVANKIVVDGEVETITIDEILNRAEAYLQNYTIGWIKANKAVADSFGVGLLAYEAGQHLAGTHANTNNAVLTQKLIEANRSPRMGVFYRELIEAWVANGGGGMGMFTAIRAPNKYGSWGMLEYVDQAVEAAPKFLTVKEALAYMEGLRDQ